MNVIEIIESHFLIHRMGWVLVYFIPQGIAVALALFLALAMLRRHTAAARYAAACTAFLLMMLMPIMTFSFGTFAVRSTPEVSPGLFAQSGEIRAAGIQDERAAQATSMPSTAQAVGTPLDEHRALDALEPLFPWLVLGWLTGVAALALRLLGGWAHVRGFARTMVSPVSAEWQEKFSVIERRLAISRPVRIMESGLAQVPVVFGWFRPVVLLPTSVFMRLSPEQLETILAHELAHVLRRDYLVNLMQTLVETLLFYHPAVWWVSHRIRVEREYCCDDLALAACGNVVTYAKALTELESSRTATLEPALSAVGGSLRHRIQRFAQTPHDGTIRSAWLPASGLTLATVVVFASAVYLTGFTASIETVSATVAQQENTPATPAQEEISAPAEAADNAGLSDPSIAQDPSITHTALQPVGVAVVEFSRVGSKETLGETSAQLYELVTEALADAPGIRLVEREKLRTAVAELRLSQSGLVDPSTASQVGRIIGARIFVVGKVMKLGTEWVVTVRLIDTLTTEVAGLRVVVGEDQGVLRLADATGDTIVEKIESLGSSRIASADSGGVDTLIATLRAEFSQLELPTLAVCIPESHIGTFVPDPAAENELISILTQAGFRVKDLSTLMKNETSNSWLNILFGREEAEGNGAIRVNAGIRSASDLMHDKRIARIKESVDIFIVGEAFSEHAGEQFGFESCRARVELKAIDTKSEAVASARSQHAVAADVAEFIAGKKALRSAGKQLAPHLARDLAAYWQKQGTGVAEAVKN